jgi:hypothetical protein
VSTVASVAASLEDESARNRVHLEAINDHLRYIYARIDDIVKRLEQLEKQ